MTDYEANSTNEASTEPQDRPPPSAGHRSCGEPGDVAALLKEPDRVARKLAADRDLRSAGVHWLVAALLGHAVFGLALGLFGGWRVGVMDLLKVPAVALISLVLCFPSLYVFACVGGAPLTMTQAFAIGTACSALVGLILAALAPVAWLFAASTASAGFVVVLALVLWIVAMQFALRFIGRVQAFEPFRQGAGIRCWFVVLVLVSLQMVTALRPMLRKPVEPGFCETGKLFFLKHFGETFDKPAIELPSRR
jgi:hypothetical protein